jgi:ferritin-like protein
LAQHAGYHEALETLSPSTIERHRAIVSLMEELEAIDWYDQRVDATTDDSLRAVLAHNRDEEREHAAMTLEWLRRNDPAWDRILRMYLFSHEPITEIEVSGTVTQGAAAGLGDLGLGNLTGSPPR